MGGEQRMDKMDNEQRTLDIERQAMENWQWITDDEPRIIGIGQPKTDNEQWDNGP